MKPKSAFRFLLLGSAFLSISPLLHAAALYWDGTDITVNADGGAGTWTDTDAWDDAATAGANATWSTGSQAVFGGTGGTVSLTSGITINNAAGPVNAITFSASGYVIDAASAQTITLGNASVISGNNWAFNSNVSFVQGVNSLTVSNGGLSASVINGTISGNGAFVKGGGGELALSGLNSYTGKSNINQGTLTVNSLKDLGTSSSFGAPTTAANGTIGLGSGVLGGTLKYTGTGGADGTTNRVIDLSSTSSGVSIDQSGTGLLKFTSAFTATGRGSKTLSLTGSTAGTGEIAAAIVNNSTSGSTALAATFLTDAGTVTLASVDGVSIGAAISGTGIAGGTTITAINSSNKTVTLSVNTTGASGAVGTFYTVTGVLNLTSLAKGGTGTWTLSGANTFTGGVAINGGTLKLGLDSRIADGIASFTINGGTFDMAGFVEGVTPAINLANGSITGTSTGFLLARGGYAGTGTNAISKRLSVRASNANSGLFNISSGTTTISGIIYSDDSTVQGITKTGGGNLTLTNPANAYAGATAITSGTLALGANEVLPDTTAVSIGSATLDAATFTDTVGTLEVTGGAVINLGTVAALSFANSSAVDWSGGTLNITGTFVPGVSLRFGTTSGGLLPAQLALITVNGGGPYTLNSSGYLIAGGATGFAAWQSANSTGGGLDDDHDGDGVSNGIEYFIHGPVATSGFTPLPGLTETSGTFSVTWTKAVGYTGTYGVNYVVETSATLANPWVPQSVHPDPGFTVTFPSATEVKYTFPAGTKNFARLKITGP